LALACWWRHLSSPRALLAAGKKKKGTIFIKLIFYFVAICTGLISGLTEQAVLVV
jgi:hypothetical protein